MKVTVKCYQILHTKAKPIISFMATFSTQKNDNSVFIYPHVILNLYDFLLKNTKRRYFFLNVWSHNESMGTWNMRVSK